MALNWFKKKNKPAPPSELSEPDGKSTAPKSSDSDSNRNEAPETKVENLVLDPENEASEVSAELPANTLMPERNVTAGESKDAVPLHGGIDQIAPETKKAGLFSRLKNGLAKTRQILTTDIDELFGTNRQIDDDMLEELEELLITSDIGVQTAMDLMQTITRQAPRIKGPEALKNI